MHILLTDIAYFVQARERASQEYIHYGWLYKTSPNGSVSVYMQQDSIPS